MTARDTRPDPTDRPSGSADPGGVLDGAFFFSPQSAGIFRDCVRRGGLDAFCAPLAAYCISEAAANMLAPLAFAYFFIAGRPNRDALFDMLPKPEAGRGTR